MSARWYLYPSYYPNCSVYLKLGESRDWYIIEVSSRALRIMGGVSSPSLLLTQLGKIRRGKDYTV